MYQPFFLSQFVILLLSTQITAFFPIWSPVYLQHAHGKVFATSSEDNEELSRRGVLGVGTSLLTGISAYRIVPWDPANAAMIKTETDPKYVISVVSHDTPSYTKWHQTVVEPNLVNGKLPMPEDWKVRRMVLAKSKKEDGTDVVHVITVFPKEGLQAANRFYDPEREFWEAGLQQGWLQGPLHHNYFNSDFFLSTIKEGPPSVLSKGSGIVFGTHPIGTSFAKWEAAFESPISQVFLESHGVSHATAGPVIPNMSTESQDKSGIGILDFFHTYADALAFVPKLKGENWAGLTVAQDPETFKPPLYYEVAQVTDDFKYTS